jgi:hypothetical protein
MGRTNRQTQGPVPERKPRTALKLALVNTGVRQQEIAGAARVHVSDLSAAATGRRPLYIESAKRLQKVLSEMGIELTIEQARGLE